MPRSTKCNRRTITRAAIHRMRGSLKGKGVLKALMRDRKRERYTSYRVSDK